MNKSLYDYTRTFILIFIMGTVIASIVSQVNLSPDLTFNKSSFMDGIVAFHTGASIALFLALAQSRQGSLFNKHKRAAKNNYYTILINSLTVVILWGLCGIGTKIYNIGIDSISVWVALFLSLQTLYRLLDLIDVFVDKSERTSHQNSNSESK